MKKKDSCLDGYISLINERIKFFLSHSGSVSRHFHYSIHLQQQYCNGFELNVRHMCRETDRNSKRVDDERLIYA